MDEWIDELARSLGEDPVSPEEMGALLRLAREVAHGVERKLAPVSTFLAGVAVGRRSAPDAPRARVLRQVVEEARRLIPETAKGEGPSPEEG